MCNTLSLNSFSLGDIEIAEIPWENSLNDERLVFAPYRDTVYYRYLRNPGDTWSRSPYDHIHLIMFDDLDPRHFRVYPLVEAEDDVLSLVMELYLE